MNLARAIQLASYEAQYDCAQEALDAGIPMLNGIRTAVNVRTDLMAVVTLSRLGE